MLRFAGATTFPDVFFLRDVEQTNMHTGLRADGFWLERTGRALEQTPGHDPRALKPEDLEPGAWRLEPEVSCAES